MPWKDKSKYRSDAYREYMRNYQKDWHQQNKAQRLARTYERKEQLHLLYNKLKENLKCAHCGENHPATIQFHHRDPQQKDFNLSAAVRQGYSAERIKREMAKCTVLCANCHAKLHYDWAAKNREPFREGLASQFLEIEEALSVSQEEELAHAVVNQYIPAEVDLDLHDDQNVGL